MERYKCSEMKRYWALWKEVHSYYWGYKDLKLQYLSLSTLSHAHNKLHWQEQSRSLSSMFEKFATWKAKPLLPLLGTVQKIHAFQYCQPLSEVSFAYLRIFASIQDSVWEYRHKKGNTDQKCWEPPFGVNYFTQKGNLTYTHIYIYIKTVCKNTVRFQMNVKKKYEQMFSYKVTEIQNSLVNYTECKFCVCAVDSSSFQLHITRKELGM
jgi:hypothetical protein